MIVEIVIYTSFVVFIYLYCTSISRFLSLIGFMASSTALEIMNITTFRAQGAIYPESIFYFPGYRFPVAIICFSAIYGGIISILSLKIVHILKPKVLRKSIFLTVAAILNLFSIVVEKAGVMSGYWMHEKVKDVTDIWHFIYLFYFGVIFGGIIFLFEESQRKTK